MQIERRCKPILNCSLTTSLTTTTEIEMEGFTEGTIFIPSGSPITTLTYNAAPFPSDLPAGPQGPPAQTFLPLYDSNLTTAVAQAQTVAAGHAVQMPAAVFGCASIKITVNSAGTVHLTLKS